MEPIVEVTQADRDLAGDVMAINAGYHQGLVELGIREGRYDETPLVQRLAAARLSTPSPDLKADNAALVEKAAHAIAESRGIAEHDRTDGMMAVFTRDALAVLQANFDGKAH